MQISVKYNGKFVIRSLADAKQFCEKILQPGIHDVPDLEDKTRYYCIIKDSDGHVSLGSAHYGPNPLTAEIPCCDDTDIYHRIYRIRRSINRLHFSH